jgi:aspartate racemase
MIGILAGMGAAAGARFYNNLIAEYQKTGALQDCDFPEIVLINISSKGMNECGVANEHVIRADLLHGIWLLNHIGAHVIVIACNTVHCYLDYLQERSHAPILSMVAAGERACEGYKYGLISSRTTRDLEIYHPYITLDDARQEIVDEVIARIIAGRNDQLDRDTMLGFVKDIIFKAKADKVLIGCTELSLAIESSGTVIDAGECLIKELVRGTWQ